LGCIGDGKRGII